MTGGIWQLALAAVAFVASHFVLSAPPVREPLVAKLGVNGFRAAYSVIALVLIVWLAMAYNDAPWVEVWFPATGSRHVSLTVMILACLLVVGGITTPNPTAAGSDTPEASARGPIGFAKITRHPMMWGLGLWGISHLLANGDLASMILFGSLTILALLGPLAIDWKRRLAWGAEWRRFADQTSYVPFVAMITGRTRLSFSEIGWWRIAAGLGLYIVLLWIHPWLFGVSPLPM